MPSKLTNSRHPIGKPWRAIVTRGGGSNRMAFFLGYYATYEEAKAVEDKFRGSLAMPKRDKRQHYNAEERQARLEHIISLRAQGLTWKIIAARLDDRSVSVWYNRNINQQKGNTDAH